MTKNDITYQEKLDELKLHLSHPNSYGRVFILVEGDTDIRLFRKFFDEEKCKVENIPGGNSKVEESVTELLVVHDLIIGIRDADFIRLNNLNYTKTNMFLTDYHDIEMTLIAEEETFSAILFEFTKIPKSEHNTIRNQIISTIENISLLKYLNEKENLELKFEGVGFQDLISVINQTFDFSQYFSRIIARSPNAKILDINLIINEIQNLKKSDFDKFQISNGHDFMKAFADFLRKKGTNRSVSDELISSLFRTNYRKENFTKTNLYRQTKDWAEEKNVAIY